MAAAGSRAATAAQSSNKKVFEAGGGKTVRLKIITQGASLSGKSCLVKRFCEGKFVGKYITTIGVDYGVKPIKMDGTKLKLNFWDLSGDDAYLEVRNEFYKDAQCIILVYDATKPDSFEQLGSWIAEARQYGASGLPTVLVGNKTDKTARVSPDKAQAFASKYGMKFFEASASSGAGVQEAFEYVIRKAAAASYPGTVQPPAA